MLLFPLEKGHGLSFQETWILLPKEAFLSFVEIVQMVLEKKISKFRQCFVTISPLSPLKKGGVVIHLNNL